MLALIADPPEEGATVCFILGEPLAKEDGLATRSLLEAESRPFKLAKLFVKDF